MGGCVGLSFFSSSSFCCLERLRLKRDRLRKRRRRFVEEPRLVLQGKIIIV